ncbi:MAG TPA: hypothetical protein VND68_00115 [Chloroflexia bacterium]|jgi:hypothetical protein|nr:hypothetical protein [Chloroflexia bacterium]
MQEAWGTGVLSQIKHIGIWASKDYYLMPQSMASDGKYLLATAFYSQVDESSPDKPGKVVMADITTGQITEIYSTKVGGIVPYGVTGDESWVVWSQAPKEPGFFSDWEMYAYNRAERSIRLIASAPKDKGGLPAIGSDGSAHVDHGRVVWSETVPDQGDTSRNIVKKLVLDTGEITTLSENGYVPVISWPYVAWLQVAEQTTPEGSTPAQQGIDLEIITLNLESGAKKTLHGPRQPIGFALRKDSVIWISTDGRQLVLTNIEETFEQIVAVAQTAEPFSEPSIDDRFITWGGQPSAHVWDRKKNSLVTIVSDTVARRFVGAGMLVWDGPASDLPGAAYGIQVLDTTKLP